MKKTSKNIKSATPVSAEKIKLKQLITLNKIARISNKASGIEELFVKSCGIIRTVYPFPGGVSVKIIFDSEEYQSGKNKKTDRAFIYRFTTIDKKKGSIEVYLPETATKASDYKDLFENILSHLTGAVSRFHLKKLLFENAERVKELRSISRTSEVLKSDLSFEDSLQEICMFLPEAWQYPEHTVSRITYQDKVFKSKNFKETQWVQRKDFQTPDNIPGSIEIFYIKKFPKADEGPFLKEERDLINNLASLISGIASKNALQDLFNKNTERLKELRALNQTSVILTETKSIEETLHTICQILPQAWQFPDHTVVRISYENKIFSSDNFRVTRWKQVQSFEAPGNKRGTIEVYYLKEFPKADEGPFLKEERNLLINLSNLIAGSAIKDIFNKLAYENRERLKELWAINQTSSVIAENIPIDDTLQKICDILPGSWQYPEQTVVKIQYEGKYYTSKGFRETQWEQKENFITLDNIKGSIEVYYLEEFPKEYEGPFLKEERNLLINIGKLVSGYLNSIKGREILRKRELTEKPKGNIEEYRKSLGQTKKPLQLFFNQRVMDKYIYLDMMKFKVKEILFVATLYDAFILEKEDSFFERFMGIIYQYSLFSLPRITGVSSPEEALELLKSTHFDLVILMVGVDKDAPVNLSELIKEDYPDMPVYLLLNQKSNLKYFDELVPTIHSIDKSFVWNGNSEIFFAIVKSTEDEVNVENDTRIGLVRVILVVEDSAQYYSKYLQMLYSIIFEQVQQLLPEVEKNELDKISKMRSRPKILLARNYEDAISIFNKYKDFMLCVISDMEFEADGKMDKMAGLKFIRYIKSHMLKLPIILQSSDPGNKEQAQLLDVGFIDKNSESLRSDLQRFLNYYLGFGDFIFRNRDGSPIAIAKSLREFEMLFNQMSDETIVLHANENQFSIWLMARGEIELAKNLKPVMVDNFPSVKEFRSYFIDTIHKHKDEKKKGRVLKFEETSILDEKNIVRFANGSLGGKGRGLAFINTLLYNTDFRAFSDKLNILTPITVIIGMEEFEQFIENNRLSGHIRNPELSYDELKNYFISGSLSDELIKKIEFFVEQIDKPIAVRSSSMSEDSITQPFSGVFDTYILQNNRDNKKQVLDNIIKTIKLVYASIYSDNARNYFKAIHFKVEEEKMAVILQELVGNQNGDYYYPHISGVAQSHNYYPLAYMKPEEGYALAAIGLGSYVVDGWKAYRFSPVYPNIDVYTTKDMMNSSQVQFYALDCSKKDVDYLKDGELASLVMLNIDEAEKIDIMKHCLSYYNPDNDRIEPGLSKGGPRVVNFANILKYNYIPLAETLKVMLNTIKDAFGTAVEIEYAVDLTPSKNGLPTFYLLQIKPLVDNQLSNTADLKSLDKSEMMLFSESSLGNGEINTICDVIFVDVNKFDKLRTYEMSKEIEYLNKIMVREDKHYILIGPGRWGTREQSLGIPVNWSQISNAKVIVEISLANFPLDSSLGSHFFHNITSMNIGYFSVQDSSDTEFIRWENLLKQKVVNKTNYFIHVQFEKPLNIYMNGRQRASVITEEKLKNE